MVLLWLQPNLSERGQLEGKTLRVMLEWVVTSSQSIGPLRTSGHGLVGKQGLWRCNWLRGSHTTLGWALDPMTGDFIRSRKDTPRCPRGEGHVRTESEVRSNASTRHRKPRLAGSQQERVSKGGFSPRAFRGSVVLLTPGSLVSGLQDWERMHFCY